LQKEYGVNWDVAFRSFDCGITGKRCQASAESSGVVACKRVLRRGGGPAICHVSLWPSERAKALSLPRPEQPMRIKAEQRRNTAQAKVTVLQDAGGGPVNA